MTLRSAPTLLILLVAFASAFLSLLAIPTVLYIARDVTFTGSVQWALIGIAAILTGVAWLYDNTLGDKAFFNN